MILVFGGTTEGRKSAAVCEEAGKPFYYSTKSNSQVIKTANGIHITGGMDENQMLSFCLEKGIRLIVDAAHPFAEVLHQNIAIVSEQLKLPVVRYERNYSQRNKDLLWFNSYDEVMDYLEKTNVNNLLALTGVNTVSKLKPYWQKHNCRFRILDRDESHDIIKKEGFPIDNILYYRTEEDETSLFEKLNPEAVLIKESGDTGGFNEKTEAAKQLKIPILVVKRPALPAAFVPVYGENGLRKKIEFLCPDFFALRTGYTTGTCATAATKAALFALLTGREQESVDITLPSGELITLSVFSTSFEGDKVSCSVLKDAGDDPDVTNGQEIISTVQLNPDHADVRFLQGEGVGVVTLPGLGLAIGGPAINETPRRMIIREIRNELPEGTGIDVTVSVPGGGEIARKTFNPKLGVVGGISIIGTSGIVKPFSSDAFIASIRREMQVADALGCEHVVINSGAKSERFIKSIYPMLCDQAFIHYGNFIGETIKIASELGFKQLTMGIMIGKAVKLAEGSLDTHSKKVIMNKIFLLELAQKASCSAETLQAIQTITMARQLWDIIPETEYTFFSLVSTMCYEVCKPLFTNGTLEVLLIDEEGKTIK
ncbi:MAG: cobalt-precorrin-5B (C(1))-methyltransferase CbiD [Tannerellaceae bacterium]|jgi:cobalt-precorrin-5B (C1)-methyltransferase|nr:cobalt-precorrin-5B (C(1))-methyltransferase CbiD [Tannerellaceae bacterium]